MSYKGEIWDKARAGDTAYVLKSLEEHGLQVDFIDEEDRRTCLHYAAAGGSLELVTALVSGSKPYDSRRERGADVHVSDGEGWTPLHSACSAGHESVMEWLAEQGVTVNTATSSGLTPLHSAVAKGHASIVKKLLERSAFVNAANRYGQTPLHKACVQGSLEIVKMLVDAGATLNARDRQGNTPLHIANEEHNTELARWLVERGADPTITNTDGEVAGASP